MRWVNRACMKQTLIGLLVVNLCIFLIWAHRAYGSTPPKTTVIKQSTEPPSDPPQEQLSISSVPITKIREIQNAPHFRQIESTLLTRDTTEFDSLIARTGHVR